MAPSRTPAKQAQPPSAAPATKLNVPSLTTFRKGKCWRCGSTDHVISDCPIAKAAEDRSESDAEKTKAWNRECRKVKKAWAKAKKAASA